MIGTASYAARQNVVFAKLKLFANFCKGRSFTYRYFDDISMHDI